MDSFGCPLCCQQKFNSIVALREHLLYFTFRPLLCVLCRMTIGGIYELTRHLETHLIREKNSTADVLRDVRNMDDENRFPDEDVAYGICDTSDNYIEPIIIDNIYDEKAPQFQYEGYSKTCINAESITSSKVKTGLDSGSDTYGTELAICTENKNSNVSNENVITPYEERDYASISTTNSEAFGSDSNSDNLSICSLSESESIANSQDSGGKTNENLVHYTESDSVRAFVCHECGTKIVGKDFYFSHLQEHTNKPVSTEAINCKSFPDVPSSYHINVNQEDRILDMQGNPRKDAEYLAHTSYSPNNNNNNVPADKKNSGYSTTEIFAIGSESLVQHVAYAKSTEESMTDAENEVCSAKEEENLTKPNDAVQMSKSCASSMQHYVHKKFDHDQERKFEGLSSNSDVQCYIQNFQSLLVNKLNQAFENNAIKSLPPSSVLCEDEERSINNSPPLEVTKSNSNKYHCRYCSKTFVWKQTRDTHEINRKCVTTNKCKYCNKEFAKNNSLCRHEQEKHANEIFFCNDCGRHFKSLRYLSNHKGVHDKKRNTCSQCPSSFHTASGLRSHIYESHSRLQKGKELICENCGEKFKRKYGLRRHIERKHSSFKFSCRYCNKEFPCKEDLNSHMIIHLHGESLSCNICDMAFTSHSSLKRHKEKHNNVVKSFQCKTCFAFFTRKDSLTSHIQSQHSSNAKYICKCGKSFIKASHLKYHEIKHSKEPPRFRCEFCQKAFKYKISLKKHNCKEKKMV